MNPQTLRTRQLLLLTKKINSSSYTPSQFATRADPTLTGNITLDGDNIRDLIETKLMQCVSRKDILPRSSAKSTITRVRAKSVPFETPESFFYRRREEA